MKKISSAGRSFHQGWNDPRATYDERPGMESSFTYDYWFDSTEVTQGAYFAVTGRRPVPSGSPYGVGDDYPVYYVSWFDAVLYCNARSRAEGLDTVYVYSEQKALSNGSVYELTGLWYDLTRGGYRLPTEAEWEYAARGGSGSTLSYTEASDSVYACYYSWYIKNAANRSHSVATRIPNSLGLYDMAGNVFEWTNDWKTAYTGQGIRNSLGAKFPGSEYEKIIKGGSYNYSLMFLRPSHRSATYATMISSANEYVGFRCARGGIPRGEYIGTLPTDFTPNPVMVMTGKQNLCPLIGTMEAKLVFVNVTGSHRTLCYVDYSKILPYVQEYLDDCSVYHPVLSPDGRHVAYCSRNEGLTGASKVSIRSLDSVGSPVTRLESDSAFIPRWWVNPSTGDTCIVYTNSASDNGNNAQWRSTKTYMQKIRGGMPSGFPEEMISSGSYHDGISVDGRNAVTGFTRLMRRDMTTGVDTQLFLSPENGKDGNDPLQTQVCNVSMSPDTVGGARCMFLDFGYPRRSTVTDTSYRVHEYLFLSDMQGKVIDFMRCLPGETSWDDVEWSNRHQFGVGCMRNNANQSHTIQLIDLAGKTSRQLASGTELRQPGIWLACPWSSLYALDSLGIYDDPPISTWQIEFSIKLHLFWGLHDKLDIVLFGNSEMYCNVDCQTIKNYSALNMGFTGCGIYSTSQMLLNYCFYHAPKLKLVGVNIPFGFFLFPPGDVGSTFFDSSLAVSKGYIYDRNHNFWRDSPTVSFYEAMVNQSCPPIEGSVWDSLGLFCGNCYGWGGSTPDMTCCVGWTVEDPGYKKNLIDFENLIKECSARHIHFLAVNMPQSPYYKYTDHYYREGPSWETARAILAQLDSLEDIYPYFHVYDAYKFGNHDYSDDDAADWNHLCMKGAAKLASRLEPFIDSILSR